MSARDKVLPKHRMFWNFFSMGIKCRSVFPAVQLKRPSIEICVVVFGKFQSLMAKYLKSLHISWNNVRSIHPFGWGEILFGKGLVTGQVIINVNLFSRRKFFHNWKCSMSPSARCCLVRWNLVKREKRSQPIVSNGFLSSHILFDGEWGSGYCDSAWYIRALGKAIRLVGGSCMKSPTIKTLMPPNEVDSALFAVNEYSI